MKEVPISTVKLTKGKLQLKNFEKIVLVYGMN